ncbi:MAG: hypothetical protein ACYTXC_01535 [Nostoc sp.]
MFSELLVYLRSPYISICTYQNFCQVIYSDAYGGQSLRSVEISSLAIDDNAVLLQLHFYVSVQLMLLMRLITIYRRKFFILLFISDRNLV